jgi:hypothetical protein
MGWQGSYAFTYTNTASQPNTNAGADSQSYAAAYLYPLTAAYLYPFAVAETCHPNASTSHDV